LIESHGQQVEAGRELPVFFTMITRASFLAIMIRHVHPDDFS
jgi:hypothetical protein